MFTDAASLGKDRVLLAASVASLPQEPLGPGGCCLFLSRVRYQSVVRLEPPTCPTSATELPKRNPGDISEVKILLADPHHPTGQDKSSLIGLICATRNVLLNCVVRLLGDTICGAGQHVVAGPYLGFPHHPARCASHTGFFVL